MATPPHDQSYHYSPLNTRAPYIRLLRILSGPSQPIKCSLEIIDLTDKPLYDCLSYTWGDPLYHDLSAPQDILITTGERICPIDCDGLVVYVSKNLEEALKQLSKNGLKSPTGCPPYQRQSLIWIDAICINQENIAERNSQVAMMNQIYTSAQTVIVWLGISDEHLEPAIDVMNRLASVPPGKYKVDLPQELEDPKMYEILGITYIEPQQWLDYSAFIQRTWFRRVWVIQETFVAQQIVVFCGSMVLLWSHITSASRLLRETQLGKLLMTFVEEAVNPPIGSIRYVGSILTNASIFDSMRDNPASLDLRKLLVYSRYFDSTNAEDHVFAILGIRHRSLVDRKLSVDITADYKLDVKQVFTKASRAVMAEMADFNLVSLVEDLSVGRREDIPSWVPDYSAKPYHYPLADNATATLSEERWNTSKRLKWKPPVPGDMSILQVEGIRVDHIVEFAATHAEVTVKHEIKTLLELLTHFLDQAYPGGDAPIEAFWRVLIKDTFRGKLAGDEARRAFPLLVAAHVWELENGLSNLQNDIQNINDDSCQPKLTPFHQPSLDLTSLSNNYSRTKGLISEVAGRDSTIAGIIPDWNTIQGLIKMGQEKAEAGLPANEMDRDYEHIAESFRIAYSGRRLFRTKGNYIGIAAQSLQRDDAVWVLAGLAVPIVLRELPNGNWKVIGEAYVHGIMNGEAVLGNENRVENINLE